MKNQFLSPSTSVTLGIMAVVLGIAAAANLPEGAPLTRWLVLGFLLVGVLLFVGGLLMGVVFFFTRGRKSKQAAKAWIADAADEDERRRRQRMVSGLGVGGALMASGIAGPMVNTDGTPMLDGGAIDIMGRAYGDTHSISSGHTFDHGSSDAAGHTSMGIGGSDW